MQPPKHFLIVRSCDFIIAYVIFKVDNNRRTCIFSTSGPLQIKSCGVYSRGSQKIIRTKEHLQHAHHLFQSVLIGF